NTGAAWTPARAMPSPFSRRLMTSTAGPRGMLQQRQGVREIIGTGRGAVNRLKGKTRRIKNTEGQNAEEERRGTISQVLAEQEVAGKNRVSGHIWYEAVNSLNLIARREKERGRKGAGCR